MVDLYRERELDLSTSHNLDNIEQRLALDIKRLQMLLSRIKNDTQYPARAETIRVYSDMLSAREDLLNQIQLQRLSREIEQRAAV